MEIDFGKFITSAGAEVIESNTNYNYSRSLLFAVGRARTITLASAPRSVGKLHRRFPGCQGWNSVYDNNSGKTFGFSGAYAWKKVTWNNSYMVGPEKTHTNDGIRHLYDTNVVLTPNDKVTATIESLYGQDGNVGGGSAKWGGVAGAMQYKTSAKTAIAGRLDFFKDADGFSTGTVQNIKEVTLTADYKIRAG